MSATSPSASSDAPAYTPAEVDLIARGAAETVVAEPGRVAPYDVEAYERIVQQAVPTGAYPVDNRPSGGAAPLPDRSIPPECVTDQGYLLRLGGFRREAVFGPCAVADGLAAAGVTHADSLGNGLFEHVLLCRRTGITPCFEAPGLGIPLPFLADELSPFERIYREHVLEQQRWIRRIEGVYGQPILEREGQPWVLWARLSPLALYLLSARRRPGHTASELAQHAGTDRLLAEPRTPPERAAQLRAWAFIRRRHMQVRATMAAVVRELLAPRGIIVGNMHAMPIVDYELMGDVFDHPGVAVRPGYLNDAAMRGPYVAYAVRLFADLSGRAPVASVRVNTLCAGTRVIAGAATLRRWCDHAVRHGIAGLYFWTLDYPSQAGQYQGPLPGQPDPSARGMERWDATLDVLRDLAGARRFVAPPADVGVLVPDHALELAGWRRVMRCFLDLQAERIWCRFVPGRAALRDSRALDPFRVLAVPEWAFAEDGLVERLERHVRAGGTVVLGPGPVATHDTQGRPRAPLLRDLTGADATRVLRGAEGDDAGAAPRTADGAHRWRDVIDRPGIDPRSWVYGVRADNLTGLIGRLADDPRPTPQPDVVPRHYMYEHSSSWLLPYIDEPEDFPRT